MLTIIRNFPFLLAASEGKKVKLFKFLLSHFQKLNSPYYAKLRNSQDHQERGEQINKQDTLST